MSRSIFDGLITRAVYVVILLLIIEDEWNKAKRELGGGT